jgi:hypothetical protein
LDQLGVYTRDVLLLLWPLQLEAIRGLLEGNLEGAAAVGPRLIGLATELGIPGTGETWAEFLTLYPLLYLGRPDETMAMTESGRTASAASWLRATYTCLKAVHQHKRSEALELVHEGLAAVRERVSDDQVPAGALAFLMEAAVTLGEIEAARFTSQLLGGIVALVARDLHIVNVARHRGGAAALFGDLDSARHEYERSLEWATRIRHRPEIALTRLAMAELALGVAPTLSQSGKESALRHLDFAIDEFRAMKMQPALERALRHKGLLTA